MPRYGELRVVGGGEQEWRATSVANFLAVRHRKDGGTSRGRLRSGEIVAHPALRLFPDLVDWDVTIGGRSLALEVS